MNNKGIIWSTCLLVFLFFLFFRIPVIQIDVGHAQYYLKTDRFELKWIHSVEKEEWVEVYVRDNTELLLTETYFKTFGAGVPSDAEKVEIKDGFVHMEINQMLEELHLVVSENVQTKITTDTSEILLYQLTDDYEQVTISVNYLSIWRYIGGEFL